MIKRDHQYIVNLYIGYMNALVEARSKGGPADYLTGLVHGVGESMGKTIKEIEGDIAAATNKNTHPGNQPG